MKFKDLEFTLIKTTSYPTVLAIYSFSSNADKNFAVSFADVSHAGGHPPGTKIYYSVDEADESGDKLRPGPGEGSTTYGSSEADEEPSQEYALKLLKMVLKRYMQNRSL